MVEVTDGWYSIPAKLDYHLIDKIRCRKIEIGCKLFVCGAEINISEQHGHPLEVIMYLCIASVECTTVCMYMYLWCNNNSTID